MGIFDTGRKISDIKTISNEPPNEFMGFWETAAMAAEEYGWGFENPAASGKTVLIDQIWIASMEASIITFIEAGNYTATQNPLHAVNLRSYGGTSVVKILSAMTINSFGPFFRLPFYAGEKILLEFNGALLISPGHAIFPYKEVGSTTGVIYYDVMWRELDL